VPAGDVAATVAAVEAQLGDLGAWGVPERFESVALALLAAVWSIGVRYQSVDNVLARYRAERLATGHDAGTDRPEDLRRFIESCGGAEGFALRMRNQQRTSTRNGILKAEAVLREAEILEREGVAVAGDVLGADEDRLDRLRARWVTVPGQGSGVSWHAFAMLIGLADVKPDRMIRRYLAAALGLPGEAAVGVEDARRIVMAAAAHLEVAPQALDNAIWAYQSRR
jgi:hypothetical protein